MDRWTELINFLNMTADWIQVIFTFFGILIALGYLRQHAEKVKLERSYYLIHGCMVKLSKYTGKYQFFYKKAFYAKFKFLLKEIDEIQAVYEIYNTSNQLRKEMVEVDLLFFEIDAEIKLISDLNIKSEWKDYIDKLEGIGEILENVSAVRGDKKKCFELVHDLPIDMLDEEHILSNAVLKSYGKLMSSLLSHYRYQEENLSIFNVFKRK